MYKSILLIFTLVISSFTYKSDTSRGIKFLPGEDWRYVVKSAREQDKPIFAMVCAPWCSKCSQMKQSVFTDPDVGSFFNEHFVNAMLNSEDTRTNLRVTGWGVKAVPTMVFLDKNHKVIYEVAGFRDSKRMLEEAQKALKDL
jgi:thioredoxin-related protein